MDTIEIVGLRVLAHHGVLPHERSIGQTFVLDLTIDVDLEQAARSDDLADTIDYGHLAAAVADRVRRTRFQLIEALAGDVAAMVLDEDDRAVAVSVRVAKPHAPLTVDAAEVAVTVTRRRAGHTEAEE